MKIFCYNMNFQNKKNYFIDMSVMSCRDVSIFIMNSF